MLCQTCGTESVASEKFCIQCGAVMATPDSASSVVSAATTLNTFAPPVAANLVAVELPLNNASSVPSASTQPPPPPVFTPTLREDAPMVIGATSAGTPSLDDTTQIAINRQESSPTEAIRIVEQTAPTMASAKAWETSVIPTVTDHPSSEPGDSDTRLFEATHDNDARSGGALATLAGLAGIATIIGSFLPQLRVESDAPIPSFLGDYKLNDFRGTNLQVAFLVAGIVLLAGAFLTASGKRFGRGLIGGAGLALAPAVACVYGFYSDVRDNADVAATTVSNNGGGGSFFSASPGAGFYILLAGALLGFFGFFVSLGRSNPERSHGLNSALCGIGAVASLIAGIGQLIPQNGAKIGDNFSDQLGNNVFIYGRLAMAILVACCGVIGFMRRSRWGIGLALGGLTLYAWQWLSSLAEFGDFPAPPAFVNPGAEGVKPHMLTTIGVLAMLLVAALALVTARRDSAELA